MRSGLGPRASGLGPIAALAALAAAVAGCGGDDASACGPTSGLVTNVVDGDTIEIDSSEKKIRYLLIDTPESVNGATDCYGQEAKQFNHDLVLGQRVTLEYDQECTDRFGRLLAYVSVGDQEINSLLVSRGYACVLYIPPNGTDRKAEFDNLEAQAKAGGRGMWSACQVVTCE